MGGTGWSVKGEAGGGGGETRMRRRRKTTTRRGGGGQEGGANKVFKKDGWEGFYLASLPAHRVVCCSTVGENGALRLVGNSTLYFKSTTSHKSGNKRQ